MQIRLDGMIERDWIKNSLELMKLVTPEEAPSIDAVFTDKFLPVKR
jgi:hypothetical protein